MRLVAVGVLERTPESAHCRRQVRELFEVGLGQGVELCVAGGGERDAHDALAAIAVALDQAVADGTVDQPDRAVVAQHQIVGDFADGRSGGVRMTPYREQELVLGWRQTSCLGLMVTPADEAAQAGAQLQEMLEIGLLKGHIA